METLQPLSYLNEIPLILAELNITRNNNVETNNNEEPGSPEDDGDRYFDGRRSMEDRALAPRVSSLENSLIEHINSSVPTMDEIVIRQRGRKKQPSKISWSPLKSPFKTPTKRNSTLHMSLLSPSPAKQLFNNSASPMKLRSSPRKRIFADTPTNDNDSSSSSTPVVTPTKRLKFQDERSMNAANKTVPIKTLLKGLNQEQLIKIICEMSAEDERFEMGIRINLPLPDIRSYENELNTIRKSITRSSPKSRLLSRTDGAAFSRASPHLTAFKKALCNHCKILNDSQHYDALIDYILIAWPYVRLLPAWDEVSHNILRKECFKVLTLHARSSLRSAGMQLGNDRINNFRNKLKSMIGDYEDVGKCQETLNFLAKN